MPPTLDKKIFYSQQNILVQIQGILTEGEGSVWLTFVLLTSLVKLLLIFQTSFRFVSKSYLNEEVSCTESSPSVSVPWFTITMVKVTKKSEKKLFLWTQCIIYYFKSVLLLGKNSNNPTIMYRIR
jgi:hypothetical protein